MPPPVHVHIHFPKHNPQKKRQSIIAEGIIVKNEEEAGEIYGRCVADLIKTKPDAVLGLATDSSR